MDLVTGALGNLAPRLIELLKDEYNLQTGLKEQIRSLSRELESAQAALLMVAEVPWDELDPQVRDWAQNIKEASYNMEDVLDTFIVRVEGGDDEPAESGCFKCTPKKMGRFFSKSKARHDIAGAIKDIMKQLQEGEHRRSRFTVNNIAAKPAATPSSTVDPRLEALYTKESMLVGIHEPRDALIEMLSVGDGKESTNKMKIVSVVGFGGLGKTTLAKAVYNKVNMQFDCRAFVSVGRNPDPKKVLRDILIDLIENKAQDTAAIDDFGKKTYTGADLSNLDEVQIINRICNFLNEKRYFIVVDDIWDISTWKIITNSFDDVNCGSIIIATTRNSEVAAEIGEVYRLKELSDHTARELFYTRIFGGDDKRHDNDELIEVSNNIIKKCHGVPLSIITIASVLAKKPIKDWSNIYNSIRFEHGNNKQVQNMKKIISFSYYDSPCHLRTCLLYLSVLPEDYIFDGNELIWRWIAEGLVHKEEGKNLFEVGDRYFHELINRCMVVPKEQVGRGILRECRVHDMVLHFIRGLSSKENFLSVLDSEQQSHAQGNFRRLAFHKLSVQHNPHQLNDIGMPKVRSFSAMLCSTGMIPPVSRFHVLRVLVLEYCSGLEGYHLEHIGKLLHLRYLGLSHTPTPVLPEEIGYLKFLQTLILDHTGIEELPASLCLLTQLMCLRADEKTRVPDWIGNLTSLVELEIYPDDANDGNCSTRLLVKELGNLRDLRVLRTRIHVHDQELGRALLGSLGNLQKIQIIEIEAVALSPFYLKDVEMEPSFFLSSNLRLLSLFPLRFTRLPAWINSSKLPNLCQLDVAVADMEQQDLEILGAFQELRSLYLYVFRSSHMNNELLICGGDGFQNLRYCTTSVLTKFEQGSMPRLEALCFTVTLSGVNGNDSIHLDTGLENLTSLRRVKAKICNLDVSPTRGDELEAALRHAADIHPNRPTLDLTTVNTDEAMDTAACICSAVTIPRPQGWAWSHLWVPRSLYANPYLPVLFTPELNIRMKQYQVMSDHVRALKDEVAKLASTVQNWISSRPHIIPKFNQLADAINDTTGRENHLDSLIIETDADSYPQIVEREIKIYTVGNQRVAALLEEEKAALNVLQPEDDGVDKISDAFEEECEVSEASLADGEGEPTIISNQ